jgi:uncharacterized membrane protein
MTRSEFLSELKRGLLGLPAHEIDDVLADYEAHFAEGTSAGRSEAEIARALGDPLRLAKELRAEAGLKRWERERSPKSLATAVVALLGLAAVDLFVLLPCLFWLAVVILVTGLVMGAFLLGGLALVVTAPSLHPFTDLARALTRLFLGIGFISGGVGGGALLILLIEWVVRQLGRYARLHYRLLNAENDFATGS